MPAGTTATPGRPRGASDKTLALLSFPGLAACEQYRVLSGTDPDLTEADRITDQSDSVLRCERTFTRPLLPGTMGRGFARIATGRRPFPMSPTTTPRQA
jgi:hypothetical protein